MGCDTNILDRTCKLDVYCGYGSYGSITERASKFDFIKHRSCDLYCYSTDYTCTNGDALYSEGYIEDDILIASGISEYTRQDIENLPSNRYILDYRIGWSKNTEDITGHLTYSNLDSVINKIIGDEKNPQLRVSVYTLKDYEYVPRN